MIGFVKLFLTFCLIFLFIISSPSGSILKPIDQYRSGPTIIVVGYAGYTWCFIDFGWPLIQNHYAPFSAKTAKLNWVHSYFTQKRKKKKEFFSI